MSSRKTSQASKEKWSSYISTIEESIQKLQQIQELLSWTNVSTIKSLNVELKNLSTFYSFLMTTKNITLSPDLGYFCILPQEIILHVLSFLEPAQICKMSCVCKYFRKMGDVDSLWQDICRRLSISDDHKPKQKTWKWLCESKLHVFKEGSKKNCPGTYIFPSKVQIIGAKNDNKYAGDWKDDCREGYGIYYWANGSLYAGEWKADKREGNGVRTWPNGNKYMGEYKNHKRHGKGEFTFSNGSVFKGDFEDNKFTHGTYTWPNGRVYTGDWNNIFRHGKGSYWWPDGRTYVGEWKNDKRHGRGLYSWPDGDLFDGEFVEGKRWGKGLLRRSNGEVYSQMWSEDKFDEFNKGIELKTAKLIKPADPDLLNKKRSADEAEVDSPPPKEPRID